MPVEAGVAWACPTCRGRTATIALLRKVTPPGVVQSLWKDAQYGRRAHGVRCPSCRLAMSEVEFARGLGAPVIDVCRRCHFVWFDAGEYETLPPKRRPPRAASPPDPEAAEALARFQVEHMGVMERNRQRSFTEAPEAPAEAWKYLPGLLGMPVELDNVPLARPAWTTYILLAVVSAISLLAFSDLRGAIDGYGFVPADPFRLGGLTLLSAFFLHAGWMHLIGNMYFLWVFGDNVEDHLGPGRYLWLLLGATLVGDIAHWIITEDPQTPCVGASGGISGVIAFYALKYPRVRLGFLFWYFWWIRFSARTAFFLWVALQLIGASLQTGGVAYGAHLGGAVVGVFFWWVGRRREQGVG